MNEGLIPRRYAKALYEVALERGRAEALYSMMGSLAKAFETEPGLHATIANPFVADSDKVALLDTAAGASAQDTTFADFLKLLVRNRRIDMAGDIARAYLREYRRRNNIRLVTVVSAVPLAPALLDRIKEIVNAHLHGASMEFSTAIDPSIIGGFVVNIDNERLDASVSDRLKELRLSLLS